MINHVHVNKLKVDNDNVITTTAVAAGTPKDKNKEIQSTKQVFIASALTTYSHSSNWHVGNIFSTN